MKRSGRGLIIIIVVIVALILPFAVKLKDVDVFLKKDKVEDSVEDHMASKTNYSVSSGSKESTRIAASILERNGNAIDAAIAISFSLGVSMPQNGGIGGGGVITVYDPQKEEVIVYDYYNSTGLEPSKHNIGIPGFLKGMESIYSDYASMDIEKLVQPSIELAKNGVEVSEDLENILHRRPHVAEYNTNLAPQGKLLKHGELLIQQDLAKTYELIVKEGFDVLYNGESELSKNLINTSGLSKDSLMNYKVNKSNALSVEYDKYTAYGPTAPFSGLTTLQTLKMYEKLNADSFNKIGQEEFHLYNDVYTKVFKDNYIRIGDSELSKEKMQDYLSDDYLDAVINQSSSNVNIDINEHQNTTSFSIIDKDGMVVVGSHTLSNYWGSLRSTNGFFYNNSLKNFSNSKFNSYDKMKRPKTFMSPTILISEADVVALGAAGSYAIPQVIPYIINLNTINNVSWSDAVDTQRISIYNKHIFIEELGLRSNNSVVNNPAGYNYMYVDIDQKLGFISLATIENGKYQSYYETTWCDEDCAISKNN